MHTFDILLQQIGLFIIYILAGVILVRTRVLSRETLEPISKFVLKMALPMNAPLLECSEQDVTEADNSSSDSENTSNEEIIDQDDTNGASGGTESSDDDYEYDEE